MADDERCLGNGAGLWRLGLAGKVLGAAVLLGLLLGRVDWGFMADSVRRLEIVPVALAGLSFLGIALLEVGRLHLVLGPFAPGARTLVRLHVIGAFFGNFLPGQLGADLYRVHVLGRLDRNVARPLALVVLLRLVGLAVLLAAALVSVPLRGQELTEWLLAHATVSTVSWTAGLVAVLAVLALGAALLSSIWARRGSRAKAFLDQTREAFLSVTRGRMAGLVALSFLVLGARILVLDFLVAGVGANLVLVDTLMVVVLATLITLIPISFAGLGLREGVVTLLLVHLGVGYEDAVLVALLGRAFILLFSGAGGVWLIGETPTADKAG